MRSLNLFLDFLSSNSFIFSINRELKIDKKKKKGSQVAALAILIIPLIRARPALGFLPFNPSPAHIINGPKI